MPRVSSEWVNTFFLEEFMRGMRTLFVVMSVAALAAPAARAQGRGSKTAPEGQSGTVQMPQPGTMAGSMIGIRLSDVTADQVKSLKLSKAEGAIVESVNPNSPASTAGIRAKDVVVEFDGEHVRSARHLTRLVSETPVGREVGMVVMRAGKRTEVHIKPEAGNWFNPQFGGMIDPQQMRDLGQQAGRAARDMSRNTPDMAGMGNRGRLGVSVQEMPQDLAESFGVKSGVLVASVQKASAAENAGLKAGDVITAVDGHNVTTPAELVSALPAGDGSHDVNLTVMRDKKELKLKATLGPASRGRTQPRKGVHA
jgi:serine protease Do